MNRKAGVSCMTLLMRIILTYSTVTPSVGKFGGNKTCAPVLSFLPRSCKEIKESCHSAGGE